MTAKEYLNQAFHLDQRINSKLDMMATLKEMSTKTTSIMQDDVVSHTRNVHSMEDAIAKMVDMQTGEEIPVTMRDSSLEYKTFDNNSRKMVNYSLSWTESQKKIRR